MSNTSCCPIAIKLIWRASMHQTDHQMCKTEQISLNSKKSFAYVANVWVKQFKI